MLSFCQRLLVSLPLAVVTIRDAGKLEAAIPELAPSITVTQMGILLISVSAMPPLAFIGTAFWSVRKGTFDT